MCIILSIMTAHSLLLLLYLFDNSSMSLRFGVIKNILMKLPAEYLKMEKYFLYLECRCKFTLYFVCFTFTNGT